MVIGTDLRPVHLCCLRGSSDTTTEEEPKRLPKLTQLQQRTAGCRHRTRCRCRRQKSQLPKLKKMQTTAEAEAAAEEETMAEEEEAMAEEEAMPEATEEPMEEAMMACAEKI